MSQEIIELNFPFEVICIDASRRPQEIPPHKWLTHKKKYTAIGAKPTMKPGKFGFVLQEIDLDESCFPYDCFAIERFGVPIEDYLKADEAVQELMEQVELEPVEL